jgi:microcystin-dependent protein
MTSIIQTFNGDIVIEGDLTLSGVSKPYVPTDGIVLWYGSVANVPPGWAVCDGTNGTPDLRDKFILGAGSTYNYGQSGGSANVTLSNAHLPSHTHSIVCENTDHQHNHVHPNLHTHPMNYYWSVGGGTAGWWLNDPNFAPYQYGQQNIQLDHTHPGQVGNAGSGQSFQILPSFYALLYIIKV